MALSPDDRVEYTVNVTRLSAALSMKAGHDKSLREIEALTGVSASTLSRLNRGEAPDMETFLRLCSYMDETPGTFFNRLVWRVVENTNPEGRK